MGGCSNINVDINNFIALREAKKTQHADNLQQIELEAARSKALYEERMNGTRLASALSENEPIAKLNQENANNIALAADRRHFKALAFNRPHTKLINAIILIFRSNSLVNKNIKLK